MTTIHFHRAQKYATAHGIVCRGDGDPMFDVLRILADRGWRGPVAFVDETDMVCMTGRRIDWVARHHRPTTADLAARKERRMAA